MNLKIKNTDIKTECKIVKNAFNNTKINHKMMIQKKTMHDMIIQNLIKLNCSTIIMLTNIMKHVMKNETSTAFLTKFESILTEMTMIYKKQSQFLLSDQCSKYCLSFIFLIESFTNLITDLIKKHCMLSFDILFFKALDVKAIFTVYKESDSVTEAEILEVLKELKFLKTVSEACESLIDDF